MMREKGEFLRFHTIKDHIKDVHDMRSSKAAVNDLITRFNSLIETTVTEAVKLAKEDKRKTILAKDMKAALEKTVGKKHLTWEEILQEVLLQKPTDLSKLSKEITKYIEEHEKR